jgi:hypothetical protein
LLRLLHTWTGSLDNIVIEISNSLKHMRIAKVLGPGREGWLTGRSLGSFAGRVGRILSVGLRGERGCQRIRWVRKMRFVELHFGDTNTISVDVTSKHWSVREFVVGLSWTLHSVVREWPVQGAGINVFVRMRDGHEGILLRLR